jgi:hypothetical protein
MQVILMSRYDKINQIINKDKEWFYKRYRGHLTFGFYHENAARRRIISRN